MVGGCVLNNAVVLAGKASREAAFPRGNAKSRLPVGLALLWQRVRDGSGAGPHLCDTR